MSLARTVQSSLGLALALLVASACGTPSVRPPPNAPARPGQRAVGQIERGLATWYGGRHDGKATASGERFDEDAMTAAHKTLPMGARVRVTNLRNGRSVIVRINDRGPYGKDHIIDLSRAAADELDMLEAGVVPCTVEVLSVPVKKR